MTIPLLKEQHSHMALSCKSSIFNDQPQANSGPGSNISFSWAGDPRPIRESLQSTHLSLLAARIPAPPSRLDPYPRERKITSRFPIDIATPLDLASDFPDCTSGLTVPTDVTLPSCPTSLPLLYSPNPFPTESRLSRVQCSVSLVFPSSGLFPFSTISLSLPSATALFQCSPSRHYPIPFFRSLHSPLVPTRTLPILPPDTSRTSRVHCSAFRMLD